MKAYTFFVLMAFPTLLLPPPVLPGSLSLPGALLGLAVAELARGPWGFSWPHLHSDRMRPDELRKRTGCIKAARGFKA